MQNSQAFSRPPGPTRDPGDPAGHRLLWLAGSLAVLATSWALLWTVRSYWNPALFFGVWTSATVLTRSLMGQTPLPLPRQLFLMVLSTPMWWWFEIVNARVQNWHYQGVVDYTPSEYALLASLAFSTVVPALDAAWHLTFRVSSVQLRSMSRVPFRWGVAEIALGLVSQALVFWQPAYFFAFVWVAPFLTLDGLSGMVGGPNLAREMYRGRWRLAGAVGIAGLGCGILWEFWNFWAMPKWTYSVPFVQFLQIFEMPLLGYLGYIPFAWSIFQLVQLARQARDAVLARWVAAAGN